MANKAERALKRRVKADDPTAKTLTDTLQALVEVGAGLAGASRKELALSTSSIFRRGRALGYIQSLKDEWANYRDRGRVSNDYPNTHQHHDCFGEILDSIDNDNLDEARFNALKAIFLVAATETVSDRNSALPQQYMKLCRKLSSGAILTLAAEFNDRSNTTSTNQRIATNEWRKRMATESGLEHVEFIVQYEEELTAARLLKPKGQTGNVTIAPEGRNRLTDLGYGLCQFLIKHEEFQGDKEAT